MFTKFVVGQFRIFVHVVFYCFNAEVDVNVGVYKGSRHCAVNVIQLVFPIPFYCQGSVLAMVPPVFLLQ